MRRRMERRFRPKTALRFDMRPQEEITANAFNALPRCGGAPLIIALSSPSGRVFSRAQILRYFKRFWKILKDMRRDLSKRPTVSYRVRGSPPRTSSGARGRPARACALVYIDLGVEAANPAVNRALLKGRLIIAIYCECFTVFLILSGFRFAGAQRISAATRRHFWFCVGNS